MAKRARAAVALGALGLVLAASGAPEAPTSPVPPEFVLPDVTIVEPARRRLAGRSIHVRDGRIESLGERRPPGSARVLTEYAGAFVLPGLVDMHVHYWSAEPELFGLLLLAHGVTAVRDAGDSEGTIFETRRRIEAGEIPGPRIFACGPILDGADPAWPGSISVSDRAAARRAVRKVAAQGADCVKVYHGLSAPVLAAIRREARKAGLPVIGHVPASVPLERAGLDDVQHLSGVPEGREDPRAPFAERIEAWSRSWRTLAPERVAAIARSARAGATAHTPTLVFWERLFRLRGVDPALERTLPRWHRDVFWDPSRPWSRTSADRRRHRKTLDRMKEVVGRLHQAGVPIHAGTDALNPFLVPGASLHAEIRHLADAGLSAEEALAAATSVPAEALRRSSVGQVAPGGIADFVIYRRDPTRDLRHLTRPEAVVIRGRLWTHRDLERRLAAHRRWFETPVVETLTGGLARLGEALGLHERRL